MINKLCYYRNFGILQYNRDYLFIGDYDIISMFIVY